MLSSSVNADCWSAIRDSAYPVVLYGTGNGADMMIDEAEKRGIKIDACFASDGFVRDRVFRGFKVISYSEARSRYGRMTVILGFGSHDRAVLENIKRIKAENDLYMPDMLRSEDGKLFDSEYYEKHRAEIDSVIPLFQDEMSIRSYQSIIDFRITGNIDYILDEQVEDVDAWKLLNIDEGEVFVDLGAYNGDTIKRFLSFNKSYKRIYGVEPDRRSFKKLEKNTSSLMNIKLYNAAISDSIGTVTFSDGRGRGSNIKGEGKTVVIPTVTIDSMLSGDAPTIIKFDTEGFEREAIAGGICSIKRYKPRMAISLYHKTEDLWRLPLLVNDINKDYKLYVRKSIAIPYWDSALYAI